MHHERRLNWSTAPLSFDTMREIAFKAGNSLLETPEADWRLPAQFCLQRFFDRLDEAQAVTGVIGLLARKQPERFLPAQIVHMARTDTRDVFAYAKDITPSAVEQGIINVENELAQTFWQISNEPS